MDDGENFEIVKRAIDEKRCLSEMYDDYYREFCPHVLGWKISTDYRKPSRRNVWMFQFGGESKRGLPEGGQWRCMELDELSDLARIASAWRTGPPRDPDDPSVRTPTCVDEIEAFVEGYIPEEDSESERF